MSILNSASLPPLSRSVAQSTPENRSNARPSTSSNARVPPAPSLPVPIAAEISVNAPVVVSNFPNRPASVA